MKILYDNEKRETEEKEVRNVTIRLNEDVDLRIYINNFGELEIQKHQFGRGKSELQIMPSVSNEIRLK